MSRADPSTAGKVGWVHFPHDADVGVRGIGGTPSEAFERAADALTAVITQTSVEPRISVEVRCKAPDLELLFVEWLNAIIYEMAVRQMLFGRFAVRIDGAQLEGTLWGEPVDIARHLTDARYRRGDAVAAGIAFGLLGAALSSTPQGAPPDQAPCRAACPSLTL